MNTDIALYLAGALGSALAYLTLGWAARRAYLSARRQERTSR